MTISESKAAEAKVSCMAKGGSLWEPAKGLHGNIIRLKQSPSLSRTRALNKWCNSKSTTSSTRTRRGGSGYLRPFSSIELACAAPAKPVRACILRKWCLHMSHLKLYFALHTSHCTLQAPHFTFHTPHCTLRTPHFTSHCTLKTPHFTLDTSHFTVHTSHFHTSHSTLHTALFTPHTSHCTLHAPRFTLHSSHSTLHLIWALLTLSQLISSHLISSHMSSKLSWITSQYYY